MILINTCPLSLAIRSQRPENAKKKLDVIAAIRQLLSILLRFIFHHVRNA